MATISSPGIGSGLDVNGILDKLMTVERQPLAALQNKATSFQTRLSALGSLKSSVSAFQDAVNGINTATKFTGKSATVVDSTIATVSASSSAIPGPYNLQVTTLANPHRLRSGTFADANTVVGSGSLTFTFGTFDGASFTANANKAAKTVTISSSQNTLAGIRDAINQTDIGVRANIVNDGSTARLTFTSTDAGAANSLRITTVDDDATNTDTSGLSQLAYDPTAAVGSGKNLTQTNAATDAAVIIDGVSITSSSNTLTNPVDGLTITLLKETTGTGTQINVAQDVTTAQTAADQFVKNFNVLAQQISLLTSYDATTKQAGPLNGDTTARNIQSSLRNMLNQSLTGISGTYTTLSSIGISFQKDGTLALDTSKFQTAIKADPNAVAALFAQVGRSTDSRVEYSSATSAAVVGSYAVAVTQAATQGTLVGNAVAALTITAGVNDTLTLDVDGTATSITLAAATYTSATALAAEIQSKLNGTSALSTLGKAVTVTQSAGVLTITSRSYGSTSLLANVAGNAATDLFGAAPVLTTGLHVAGTVGGQTGTGSGQFLTSNGLTLKVTATSAGSYGTFTYSKGYASLLTGALDDYLKADGLFQSRSDGLNASLKSLQSQQTALNERLTRVEANYRAQFTALDTMIARMNQTSSFLTQQLTSLSNLNKQ